jgi:hypothetical protein
MSREISRKIVEDIYSDTYVSLKEDVSKVISEKAVSVLEDMKSHVAKRFFAEATFGINSQGGDVVDTPDGGKAQQQIYYPKGNPKYNTSQNDSKPTPDSTTQTPPSRTQQSPNYPVYPKDSDAARDFRSAFRDARTRGDKEFTWQGRKYGTELAKPQAAPAPQAQSSGQQSRPAPQAQSSGQQSRPAPQAQAPGQQSRPAPQTQGPVPRQKSIPAPQAQAPGQQSRPAPKADYYKNLAGIPKPGERSVQGRNF